RMAKGLELFKKTVRPILETKCLKCHGGKRVESEFDLSDRDGFLKGGTLGKVVEPGKSADSKLMKLLRHQQEPFMPKGSKLENDAIGQIAAWIDLGAPYDNPLVATKVAKLSWTQRTVAEDAKQFWSFRPLTRAVPPAVKDPSWPRTNVDRFILAAMEKAK